MVENQKAIEINPDNALAITQKAELHLKKGDRAAALAEVEKALNKDPDLKPAKELLSQLQGASDATRANSTGTAASQTTETTN
jgi:Tfp pilus assembly protein PilF